MKRLIDIILSLLLLILLAPVWLALAIIIKLDSRGPVIYRALRVGYRGRLFTMYKFRTMVAGADRCGQPLTRFHDSRVTRAGALLRRSRLDELPQLFNVFRGDMSFVGPRPEDPVFVELYSDAQRRVLSLRPGITGPSQLLFSNESELLNQADYEKRYVEEIMPRKLSVDIDYVDNHNLAGDLRLLLKTLSLPFSRR